MIADNSQYIKFQGQTKELSSPDRSFMEVFRSNDQQGSGKSLPATRHRRVLGPNLDKQPAVLKNSPSKAASQGGPSRPYCKPEEPPVGSGTCSTPVVAHKDRSKLLDAYEIKMISKELSRYIESSGCKFQAGVCPGRCQDKHQQQSQQSRNMTNNTADKYKKILKGFWIGPAMVCSTGGEGVVTPSARFHGHRPNHHAPAADH